jgi:hypothetical protein
MLDAPTLRDPVVDAYRVDDDRTLIAKNLHLSVEERFLRLMELQRLARELHEAGEREVIDFPALTRMLVYAGVEFIIVGGAAATAHG